MLAVPEMKAVGAEVDFGGWAGEEMHRDLMAVDGGCPLDKLRVFDGGMNYQLCVSPAAPINRLEAGKFVSSLAWYWGYRREL